MSLASHLDIKSIPELGLHERDRAWQRVVVCLIATGVWTFELWSGRFEPLPYRIGLVLSTSYLLATLAYLRFGNWALPAEGKSLYFSFSSIRCSSSACWRSIRAPSPSCIRFFSSSLSEAESDTG